MILGTSCRAKVKNSLREQFTTISDAEEAYGISYFDGENSSEVFDQVASSSPSGSSRPPSYSRSPMLDFSPLCD